MVTRRRRGAPLGAAWRRGGAELWQEVLLRVRCPGGWLLCCRRRRWRGRMHLWRGWRLLLADVRRRPVLRACLLLLPLLPLPLLLLSLLLGDVVPRWRLRDGRRCGLPAWDADVPLLVLLRVRRIVRHGGMGSRGMR